MSGLWIYHDEESMTVRRTDRRTDRRLAYSYNVRSMTDVWQNDKMKIVLEFVAYSVDRDSFAVTHHWLFYADKLINRLRL